MKTKEGPNSSNSIRVPHRLVDAGTTVVAFEHTLNVMVDTYWVIDAGLESGDAGKVTCQSGIRGVSKNSQQLTFTHFARKLSNK